MARKVDRELIVRVQKESCIVCGWPGPNDAHHLKTKGSGGPDEEWNLVPVCRKHHNQIHDQGLRKMAVINSKLFNFLKTYNWYFDEVVEKWRHREGE